MAYDHVHLAVANPQEAHDWYVQHLDGNAAEFPGRVAFQPWPRRPPLPVQFLFNSAPDAQPSMGSVVERIGFSFANLDEKIAALRAAGIATSDAPTTNWRTVLIRDPWGVTIELVQDHSLLGFHHAVLRVPDIDATLGRYRDVFGGTRLRLNGGIEALRFANMYLIVLEGDGAAPSRGRAVNHLSWGPTDIKATLERARRAGMTVTSGPSGPNKFGHYTAFVEDSNGVYVELVQHSEFLPKP